MDNRKEDPRLLDTQLDWLSHELLTPLSSIRLCLEMLKMNSSAAQTAQGEVPRAWDKLIKNSLEQSYRMELLIRSLMNSRFLSQEKLEIHLQPFEFVSATKKLIHDLKYLRRETPILLNVRSDLVLWGKCDSIHFNQLLTNLLTNALKYGGDSPVQVSLSVDKSVSQNLVSLETHNFGTPIAQSDLQRVFEKSFRAHASNGKIPGLGLGLFIVKKIADAHGWDVSVKSMPGEGTTFSVKIPIEELEKGCNL